MTRSPYELEAANGKGAGMKSLGDILGGLGSVGLTASLNRNVAPQVATLTDPITGEVLKSRPLASSELVSNRRPAQSAARLPSFASPNNPFRVY
jgi:hypothetical protein